MLKKNSKGVTLMETFIAAFIFIISVAAIFSTLLSMRKPVVNNDQQLEAVLFLRSTLESFRIRVDTNHMNADYLMNGDLSLGHHTIPNTGPEGIYNIDYDVNRDAATGAYRVDATISWPDVM